MNRGPFRWLALYRPALLLAPVVFGLLAAGAAVHAGLTGQPLLPLITAWAEWFAALLLLPLPIVTTARALSGRRMRVAWRSLMVQGCALALAVFALDLVFRAAFRLGWAPYFGN